MGCDLGTFSPRQRELGAAIWTRQPTSARRGNNREMRQREQQGERTSHPNKPNQKTKPQGCFRVLTFFGRFLSHTCLHFFCHIHKAVIWASSPGRYERQGKWEQAATIDETEPILSEKRQSRTAIKQTKDISLNSQWKSFNETSKTQPPPKTIEFLSLATVGKVRRNQGNNPQATIKITGEKDRRLQNITSYQPATAPTKGNSCVGLFLTFSFKAVDIAALMKIQNKIESFFISSMGSGLGTSSLRLHEK